MCERPWPQEVLRDCCLAGLANTKLGYIWSCSAPQRTKTYACLSPLLILDVRGPASSAELRVRALSLNARAPRAHRHKPSFEAENSVLDIIQELCADDCLLRTEGLLRICGDSKHVTELHKTICGGTPAAEAARPYDVHVVRDSQ